MAFEIFIYYFPAIGQYFYLTQDGTSSAVERVEKWMKAIEQKNNLFFSNVDCVVDVATHSIRKWNLLKGRILRNASSISNAFLIYSTIFELEKDKNSDEMKNTILPGIAVYRYLMEQKKQCKDSILHEALPEHITKRYDAEKVLSIFK